MSISVRPRNKGMVTQLSSRYHPYSDTMLDRELRKDREKFDYRRECAAFDRQRKRLNDAKRKGRVIYG